jgi:hypothetical protein
MKFVKYILKFLFGLFHWYGKNIRTQELNTSVYLQRELSIDHPQKRHNG